MQYYWQPLPTRANPYSEVGTKLYIAPEVSSRKKGPRNHNKADIYSLGVGSGSCIAMTLTKLFQIVFFEMNYPFSTGAERIAVIEDLRKPEVYFPRDWEAHRTRQKESGWFLTSSGIYLTLLSYLVAPSP